MALQRVVGNELRHALHYRLVWNRHWPIYFWKPRAAAMMRRYCLRACLHSLTACFISPKRSNVQRNVKNWEYITDMNDLHDSTTIVQSKNFVFASNLIWTDWDATWTSQQLATLDRVHRLLSLALASIRLQCGRIVIYQMSSLSHFKLQQKRFLVIVYLKR